MLSTAIPIVIAAIVIVIISRGIDKYPIIIYLGSALLGWIAGDMIQTDIFVEKNFDFISTNTLLPLIGSVFVLLFSFLFKSINK